jgi:DNA-binding NarL/FixJ family response regulator
MARVLALVPDLLFGSRLQAALTAAGHDLELIGTPDRLRERLRDRAAPADSVLVVDLTDERLDGAALVQSLSSASELRGVRTLGFFSHVDTVTRERAERAGFDLVVPRSRMAREAGALVTALSAQIEHNQAG